MEKEQATANAPAAPTPVHRLIRKPVVEAMTGLTARSIYNKVREGLFPKPVLLDARQCAFVESEVVAWIRARVVDRDIGFIPQGRAQILAGRRRGGQAKRRKSESLEPQATQSTWA